MRLSKKNKFFLFFIIEHGIRVCVTIILSNSRLPPHGNCVYVFKVYIIEGGGAPLESNMENERDEGPYFFTARFVMENKIFSRLFH